MKPSWKAMAYDDMKRTKNTTTQIETERQERRPNRMTKNIYNKGQASYYIHDYIFFISQRKRCTLPPKNVKLPKLVSFIIKRPG